MGMTKELIRPIVTDIINEDLSKLDELNSLLNEVGIPDLNFSIRQIGQAAGKLLSKKLTESSSTIADKFHEKLQEQLTDNLIEEALKEIDFKKLVIKQVQESIKQYTPQLVKNAILSTDNYGRINGLKRSSDLKNIILDRTMDKVKEQLEEMFK